MFAFHLSNLAGPTSQFLNGMHEFSELVLAIMALLMDLSRSAGSPAPVGQSAGIWACATRSIRPDKWKATHNWVNVHTSR